MGKMRTPEQLRIQELKRYHILDTPPDGAFDRITRLAAQLLKVPIAIVSLVDTDRVWFKSHHGINVDEVDRVPGLCASAVFEDGPYILNDASTDPRSLSNPLVAGELGFRFYSAIPLITQEGYHLGVLCVIDYHPREITAAEVNILETLAQIVMDEMELRLSARSIDNLNKELELLIHSAGEGVCKVGNDCKVKIWNTAAEKMTGYSREEMLNQNSHLMVHHSKMDGSIYLQEDCPISKSVKEGLVRETSEEVFWRKDGTPFPVEYISAPIFQNDQVTGAVVFFKDITEKKKTEELLRRSDKLKTVGQLAAGVAHEIRNPLTTLKGFLHMLGKNTDQPQYFEIMKEEVNRIEFIANEFLVLSKPQSVRFEEKALMPVLSNVRALLESEAILKNLSIDLVHGAPLPTVFCDVQRLKQVFINILKNAIEASPKGGAVIIQCEDLDQHILIRIIDQGCGMDAVRLQHLGEPFYSTKEKGTGLGLMVSYKIVQEHHGEISVSSELDKGTTVEIILPVYLKYKLTMTDHNAEEV